MPFKIKNNIRGVTLIEVVIYIALFSVLIGGAIVTTYNLFESNHRDQTQSTIEIESQFIHTKIAWVISEAQWVTVPTIGNSGGTLSVTTDDPTLDDPLVIHQIGNNITITRGNNPATILNRSDVHISNLAFSHDTNPSESITVTYTLTALTPEGRTLSHDFNEKIYVDE